MFESLFTVENLIAFLMLTSLEVVLGIDNLVVIAILSGKLPPGQRERAQRVGLLAAMGVRIALLLSIAWIMRLTEPLFELFGHAFSWRDLILIAGGLVLIGKSTHEIHDKIEGPEKTSSPKKLRAAFGAVIVQIALLDIIFSLDSVITAVGVAESIPVMVAAIVVAILVMMAGAKTISSVIERHPTLKVLALAFLILIGVMLTAEGLGKHIEKGYIYFAMAFSLIVELINIRVRGVRAEAAAQ